MDKQKQIEEIKKYMRYFCITETVLKYNRYEVEKEIEKQKEFYATALYNAGYRKIPENAVVLTREEYDELCCSIGISREEVDRVVDLVEKDTRKETAKKFAEKLKDMAYQSTDWSHGVHPMVVEVDYIDEILEEITEGKV